MRTTAHLTILCALAAPCTVWAQSTTWISINSTGPEALNWQSGSIPADGGFAAYVFDDQISFSPVIYATTLYVRRTATTSLSAIATRQGGAETEYWGPQISGDGRFVIYANPQVIGGPMQVYIHSLTGPFLNAIVSVDPQGGPGTARSYPNAISFDGRFVAFESSAPNIGIHAGIFVRDRATNVTEPVFVTSAGVPASGGAQSAAISDDGRFVAFDGISPDLVPGVSGAFHQIFLRDRLQGTTECVSVDAAGFAGNQYSEGCSISSDGRFVAFLSRASNLVPNDNNAKEDVFVRDRLTAITRRVSVGQGNEQANGDSRFASISGDGRFVAFSTFATNLLGTVPSSGRVVVRDLTWNRNELASLSPGGAEAPGFLPHISVTGRYVLFEDGIDVYLRDRGATPGLTYCTGEGQSAVCPCANSSPLGGGQGCLNSLGTGARLDSSGTASISADMLVLHGSGMPDSVALYFQGSLPFAGGLGAPFGDGLRCVGGTMFRFAPKVNANGASSCPGSTDPSISVQGNVLTAGSRFYQVRYRNAASFCTSATFNMSNGLEIVWIP